MAGRLVRLLAWLLVAASVVYLARFSARHVTALPELHWSPRVLAGVAVAIALYLVAVVLGGCAWHLLLRHAGQPSSPRLAIAIHLLAQPAKYLPGRVGQVAGRLALARRHGFATSAVLQTVGLESGGGLAAAALAIVIAVLLGEMGTLPRGLPHPLILGAVAAAMLAAAAAWLARPTWLGRLLRLPPMAQPGHFGAREGRSLAALLALYLAVFLIYGAAASILRWALYGLGGTGLIAFTGILAAAWLGGFVTPTAPAGLGVREAVLVSLLRPLHGGDAALGLALVFRAVTTLGDVTAFTVGLLAIRGLPPDLPPSTGGNSGSACLEASNVSDPA